MSTLLIANNCTIESGSFLGDQCCAIKVCYLFVENTPNIDRVIMSVSPSNQLHFLWEKFIEKHNVELIWDDWNPGDWNERWRNWDIWRSERSIEGIPFSVYKEHHLRIHGAMRQSILCEYERGLGRRNIYQYWYCGQENKPEELPIEVDWFDDSLIYHPKHTPIRDVYISPHCKTQGNLTFTFDFWSQVVHKLIDAGVSVTVGYDGYFCEELNSHPLYKKHWGTHKEWMEQLCQHKIVACGNTGTGWLAAACGVPLLTMEPPLSQMPDHRYRECGLRNIVEVLDTPDADYCAKRLIEEVKRKVVMTTGCYDVLHAGHVRHLEKSKALGTKLIVALNSDKSVQGLKGPTRPINPEGQRKTVLEALRCVDEVRLFDESDAQELIEEIKPDVLTAGFGYTVDKIIGRHLAKQVVVTCEGDAKDEPSTTKIVQKVLRSGDIVEICRIGATYSCNPFDKLKLMANEFLKVAHLEGDVADLGTCRGGTGLILRRLAPDKRLHLFDTWEGTPYDDDLCHHKAGEWKANKEDCKSLIPSNENTHYCAGVFPYSVEGKPWITGINGNRQFCFMYVDMDTYQATHDAIEFFWPRLVSGGKIMIDDYGWECCRGVRKAVDEFDEMIIKEGNKYVIQSQFTCLLEKI